MILNLSVINFWRIKNMFDNNSTKTQLIIVCDEKLMDHANHLMALIGQNDDVDSQVVGTKDGTIQAAIWEPKHYRDSLPKITSSTNILFIGRFKEAKEQEDFIDFKFDKYGMRYGWLGKRAVMYVEDTILNKDEYEQFLSFSKEYQKKFKKVTIDSVRIIPNVPNWIGMSLPVVSLGYELMLTLKFIEKVRQQQYNCLTKILYLEGLQKFLEG